MRDVQPDWWLHPEVALRPSDIAGRGLFAGADLPAGVVVTTPRAPVAEVGSVNHACDPNLGWADAETLVTTRDVASGEELVVDYAMSTTDRDWFLRCHCPSYRCRQMIEGTDWRIPQLQRRYDGHWAPHVQRLIHQTKSQS